MVRFGKLHRYNVDPNKPLPTLHAISTGGGVARGVANSYGYLGTFTDRNELLVPIKYEEYTVVNDGNLPCWIKILRGNGQIVWMFAKPAFFEEVIET